MRQQKKFWESWDTDLRYPYLFLMALGLVALLLGVYYYFTGNDYAYAWDKLAQLQVVPVPVQEVDRMLEPFTLYADGFLLTEQYDLAPPAINTMAAFLFLAILGCCMAFFTAAISTMKQLPFLAGMLLLLMLIVSFNLDLLGIFGSEMGQTTVIGVVAVLGLTGYAFQAFFPQTRFLWRLLVLLLVIGLVGALVFLLSDYAPEHTALHLVNYSALATLVATFLFMIWVSYENVNALLWINTQGSKPERRFSLWQFMLICILYLLNLLVLYLRHVGYIKIDLLLINGYVILLLSTVAGLWGMRQREAFYGKAFAFRPAGAVVYLVFATITFLSIGYAFATANDSLTVLYHDLIVYTHLAFGVIFFIYVMTNFGRLIDQRLQVYKVVYQPKRLPLYTLFTMGAMLLAVLVMRTQYRTYYYAYAGYYNYIGDVYRAMGNNLLAEGFYKESDLYDRNNVKANYSLAGIYRETQQYNSEVVRMKEAVEKRPNPKLFVRLANLYDEKQYFFEKMYVLRQGISKFPESGELYNNMALLYSQTSVTDSVTYYFDLARRYSGDSEFVRSNRLAFYTLQAQPETVEAILDEKRTGKYKTLRSNMAAVRQLLGRPVDGKGDFAPDSLQQVEDFTLFYNTVISNLAGTDTSVIKHIDNYLASPENRLFHEDMLYLKGLVHHFNGRPKEARRLVENLALQSEQKSGYYYNALAVWMLEERNNLAAAWYFKQAKDRGYVPAFLSQGYALALAHQPVMAQQALEEVAYTELESAVAVAQNLSVVLEQDVQTIIQEATDAEKVQYLQTYLPRLTQEEVDALVRSVQERELRRYALVARVNYLMLKKRWKQANEAIKETAQVLQPESDLRSELNLLQLKVWLYTDNFDVLLNRMDNIYLTSRDKRYNLYFRARIAEAKGRDREAAERYRQALAMLLHDEEVVASAAAFYRKYSPDTIDAYNILLDGITYNPFSVPLHKAYAFESLDQGLDSYGEQALETLQDLLSVAEYSTFRSEFEERRAAIQARGEAWDL